MPPLSEIPLVAVPCEHDGDERACSACRGTGQRFVPRSMTAREFDRLYEPLRMFRERGYA